MGKSNPNNATSKKSTKDVQSKMDRHADAQTYAFMDWERSKKGSKKQYKASHEHDRRASAVKAGTKILIAKKKAKTEK